jgi:hypothetical protein
LHVRHLLLLQQLMAAALQQHHRQLAQQLHLQPLYLPFPLLQLLLQPHAAAVALLLPPLLAALLPAWQIRLLLLRLLLLGVRAALPAASASAAWRSPRACQQPAAIHK